MRIDALDSNLWEFVRCVGLRYSNERWTGAYAVMSVLRIADQIRVPEREEWVSRLLSHLMEMADQREFSPEDIHRVCGACLILGRWRTEEAAPTIARFLKSPSELPALAATESLNMISSQR